MKMDIGEETRMRAIDADGRRLAWRSEAPGRLAAMIREFVLG